MDYSYYSSLFRQLSELKEKQLRRQTSLVQTSLVLQSTLLGVLSSLLPSESGSTVLRLVYLLALVALLLGILSSAIVMICKN